MSADIGTGKCSNLGSDASLAEWMASMMCNPSYCLKKIHSDHFKEKDPFISEDKWIEFGEEIIKEKGSRFFLEKVLKGLKSPMPKDYQKTDI